MFKEVSGKTHQRLERARRPGVPGSVNWSTYGGNLASHRYAPLDQINKENFGNLRIAWRLKTDFLGPTPDNLYSATPLYVNGVLYTTAGTRLPQRCSPMERTL